MPQELLYEGEECRLVGRIAFDWHVNESSWSEGDNTQAESVQITTFKTYRDRTVLR